MWLYCTGTDSPNPINKIPNIVLFDYHNSRAGVCVVDYLSGYNGYLQVDGYQAYAQTKATLVGCWAHARRKFIEAKQVQGKNKSGKADMALSYIQKLYAIEAKLKGKTLEERYEARQQQASPLLKSYMIGSPNNMCCQKQNWVKPLLTLITNGINLFAT